MFSVYTLIDPRDDVVRYVGITENVYSRFSQHLQCNENNLDKNKWIQELKDCNLMLLMRTLETVETLEEAREREQEWIHHYLSQGVRLFNIDVVKSFTYEDFLAKFGKPVPKKKSSTKSLTLKPSDNPARGDGLKRVQKVLKRMPNISVSELAKRASVSRAYASRIRAQVLSEEIEEA